ncbi:hypothetical protein Agub_g1574, partial [Astrephomene gubernaculifera]
LGFKEILATRRMGSYLQIERCEAACDAAVVAKLEQEGRTDSSIVLDLYECWRHFPEDASFSSVLSAGQKHLVRHFGDALAILNTDRDKPGTLARQFMSLPPQAVEALLSSDDFGTDSEASVLLLLALWAEAHPWQTLFLARLSRLIRVLHLTPTYLYHVLPKLHWFDATRAQLSALTALAVTTDSHARSQLRLSLRASGIQLGPDPSSGQPLQDDSPCKWLFPQRRQCLCLSGGLTFPWRVRQHDLSKLLRTVINEQERVEGVCRASFVLPAGGGCGGEGGGGGGGAAGASGDTGVGEQQQQQQRAEASVVYAHGLAWEIYLVVHRKQQPFVGLRCGVPLQGGGFAGMHDLADYPTRLTMERASAAPAAGVEAAPAPAAAAAASSNDRQQTLVNYFGTACPGVGKACNFLSCEERVEHLRAVAAGREPDLMRPWGRFMQPEGCVRGELNFMWSWKDVEEEEEEDEEEAGMEEGEEGEERGPEEGEEQGRVGRQVQ